MELNGYFIWCLYSKRFTRFFVFFLSLFNHSHTHIHTMKTASYHAGNWPDHQEQFWDQCLAQRHFDTWTGGS